MSVDVTLRSKKRISVQYEALYETSFASLLFTLLSQRDQSNKINAKEVCKALHNCLTEQKDKALFLDGISNPNIIMISNYDFIVLFQYLSYRRKSFIIHSHLSFPVAQMKRILAGVQDKLLKLKMSTAYWEKSFHYNSSDNDDSQI